MWLIQLQAFVNYYLHNNPLLPISSVCFYNLSMLRIRVDFEVPDLMPDLRTTYYNVKVSKPFPPPSPPKEKVFISQA